MLGKIGAHQLGRGHNILSEKRKWAIAPWVRSKTCGLVDATVYAGLFVLSLIAFASTPKTPNSGWMGQYVAPSFPPIFTGIPVFRPWIIVERLEWETNNTQFLSQNLAYALTAFLVLAILWNQATRHGHRTVFALILIPLLPTMFFAGYGGPLYDITFALALILALTILTRNQQTLGKVGMLGLALCVVAVDHSRPTGLVIAIALLVFTFLRYQHYRWILLAIFALLALPFHLHNYYYFGTVTLSTYGGANLREVFPFGRDCVSEIGFTNIDSRRFAECSNDTARAIVTSVSGDPSELLPAVTLNRIQNVIAPELVWHGTALRPDLLNTYLIRSYEISMCMLWFAVVISLRRNAISILALFILAFGLLSTLLAHSGYEAVRIVMPFVVLGSWMVLSSTARWRKSASALLPDSGAGNH